MTPNEAGRELARVQAVVRSAGRRIALWRGASFAIPLLITVLLAGRWPGGDWAEPGSLLPFLLSCVVLAAMAVVGLVVGGSVRAGRLRSRAPEIEAARGLARGEFLGAVELGETGSEPTLLADLHRERVAGALRGSGIRDLLPRSHQQLRSAQRIALPALGVLLAVVAAGWLEGAPSARRSMTALLRPWAIAFPPPPPPLRLSPPGGAVLRGTGFDVHITALGRSHVLLGQSRPGTPTRWDTVAVVQGAAAARIEPVDEVIEFWLRDDRGSATDTFAVIPIDPFTVTDLRVELHYPKYLDRTRDLVRGQVTRLEVPRGTRLAFAVRTNHPIERLGLIRTRSSGIDTLLFTADGDRAAGEFVATGDVELAWGMAPRGTVPAVRPPPAISLSVSPDEPPAVEVVYPGADLQLGLDTNLSLVIEARDDHGLREVGLEWRRVTAGGVQSAPAYDRLSDADGARRLVLRPTLDLGTSGLLPGDEIVYVAKAMDANPHGVVSVSDTFRARIAALHEMKDEATRRAEALVGETRALRDRAGELSDESRNAERRSASRTSEPPGTDAAGSADFGGTREARDLLGEARDIEERLEQVREDLRAAREDLESSPLVHPDLQERLHELEELFQEILESGLRERIEALEESLRTMNRDDIRNALTEFARQSSDLEARLDRALGLMERVALEQSLEGVRREAQALAERQEHLAEGAGAGDEEWRQEQDSVASRSEDLAERVEDLADRLQDQRAPDAVERGRMAAERARAASSNMRSASRRRAGEPRGADTASRREARAAAEQMEAAERDLAAAGESLSEDWRGEAMEAVGRAMSEALELAGEQARVVDRLRAGETSGELSSSQSAIRQGLDNLSQSLADAGRKTALMDRRAGPAAERAGREMDALGQSLSAGGTGTSQVVQQGEAVIEALGDLAGSLMASRRAMSEASSATGMEEALEKLAGMGQRQAGLNSESGELFMFMQGGQPAEDRLGPLAARQRAISEDLRDLAGDPGTSELGGRPAELAAEADDIARRLLAGSLDRETLARQEQLFRRLLDAGRSLEQDETDANRRESTPAGSRVVMIPESDGADESGPRFPYPTEALMEGLTPSQRLLVYEYFDRLNGQSPEGRP